MFWLCSTIRVYVLVFSCILHLTSFITRFKAILIGTTSCVKGILRHTVFSCSIVHNLFSFPVITIIINTFPGILKPRSHNSPLQTYPYRDPIIYWKLDFNTMNVPSLTRSPVTPLFIFFGVCLWFGYETIWNLSRGTYIRAMWPSAHQGRKTLSLQYHLHRLYVNAGHSSTPKSAHHSPNIS